MRFNWRDRAAVSIPHGPFDDTLEMAKDPDAIIRRNSVARILTHFDAASARFLLHSLAEDSDPSVREAAIQALGEVGDPSTIRYLRSLSTDEDFDVSVQAVQSIKTIEARFGLRRLVA